MNKRSLCLKNSVSIFFTFILLLLITFSLTINPIAATQKENSKLEKNAESNLFAKQSSALIPTTVFSNPAVINIPDNTASIGQSDITLSGLAGTIVATTTAVTSSASTSVFGQPVTFTATVSTAGMGTPTGNVQFLDGASAIGGPVALNASGQAQVMTSTLSVGNHTITVNYAGDVPSGFNPSSGSLASGQQVNAANTTTSVGSSANPSGTGTQITFTVTVSANAPSAATVGANGTVTFRRNGSPVCSNFPLNASSQATCQLTFTIAGNYNITAQYNGTANFNASNNNAAPLVQQALGPTAAHVSVGGRVLSTDGRGVAGARIVLTDTLGEQRIAITNPFGYYRFYDVEVGGTYILTVSAKGYEFKPATQVITVTEELANLDFIGEG